MVAAAAAEGARLAALPENFYMIGRHERDKVEVREPDGAGPIQQFLAGRARKTAIWIGRRHRADLVRAIRASQRLPGVRRRGQAGRALRQDAPVPLHGRDERYDEARTIEPGDAPVAIAARSGALALSVCYDVRFPELYRGLGEIDLMFVPSAFTVPTGPPHWETLLRARAIENKAYVVAPAQGGTHPSGRRT